MEIQETEDVRRLESWRLFTRVYLVVVRALERDMEDEQKIPLSWYEVLARLYQSPGGSLRMQALADSLVYSRSGLTRLLDRMEKAGLIERHPDAHDRRGWNAIINREGEERLKRGRPYHHRGIKTHFLRHLNDADLQALNRLLSKVLEGEASPAAVKES